MSYQRVSQDYYLPPGYGIPPQPPVEVYPPPGYDGYPPPPPGYPAHHHHHQGGGYQGYFNEGYPPPPLPPQPYPPTQVYHSDHYDPHDNGCFSFLKGCFAALCCCCLIEECCF